MLGLSMDKLLIVMVLAAVVIGPHRLPHYAHLLATFTRQVRDALESARTRIEEESGVSLDDEEWRQLDPRRYDPRTIIREALEQPTPSRAEDQAPPVVVVSPAGPASPRRDRAERQDPVASDSSEIRAASEPSESPRADAGAGPLCAACAAPLTAGEDVPGASGPPAITGNEVDARDDAGVRDDAAAETDAVAGDDAGAAAPASESGQADRSTRKKWVVVGGTSGHPIRRLVDVDDPADIKDDDGAHESEGDRLPQPQPLG
ncbi:hypothetical protein [Demequina sp. NBRC 110054]|uniref:hypothetical protein n=1 Tax=Demequina sp. NBRC 110054 TaxID=1570343 RepID=UPI001178261A|nr:hypothetical protein [Demequina sp. NBRC 110054]